MVYMVIIFGQMGIIYITWMIRVIINWCVNQLGLSSEDDDFDLNDLDFDVENLI